MHCLTWHGTVLRVDRNSGQLIHALPWPVRSVADDWSIEVPEDRLAGATACPDNPDLMLLPAGAPGLVHIRRQSDFLCAELGGGEARYSRRSGGIWETFRVLSPEELARLRRVLSAIWTTGDGEEKFVAAMESDFRLRLGGVLFDLRGAIPGLEGTDTIFGEPSGDHRFFKVGERPAPTEIELRRRSPQHQAPMVADISAWRRCPDTRLAIASASEIGHPPITVCREDGVWLRQKWSQPGAVRLGHAHVGCQVVRELEKYVLLSRGQEGIIFDELGTSNEDGYLSSVGIGGTADLTREGSHVFVSYTTLDRAKRLPGSCAVFCNGNLSNYYHWVIDALLPLHAMAAYLPADTRLLIPGTLRDFRLGSPTETAKTVDHIQALVEWGLGDLPRLEVAESLCHAEEVYWLDNCAIEQMPRALVQAARAGVLARVPASGEKTRIYMRRADTRSVANAAKVEQVMLNNGFSFHEMEGLTPREQIQLFRNAEFVVAPHGAGMANLLFCEPGTKVIELSPDCEFRPLFAQISDKLDLAHAVLPCPTDDEGFFGRMTVDVEKFRALVRHMLFRL
jgi:hypothetical protein